MKRSAIISIILTIGFWAHDLRADIFSWTDENGVVHYTNYNPPKEAKIILKAAEFTRDVNVVQESRESDRLDSFIAEIKNNAEPQAMIAGRQQAIADRLDEANRKAEHLLERNQDLLDEAQSAVGEGADLQVNGGNDYTNTFYNGSYITYGYIPYYPYHRYHTSLGHGGFRYRHFRYYRYGKRHFDHRKDHYYPHSIRRHSGAFSKHHGRKFYYGSRYHGFRDKSYYYKRHFRGSHRFKGHFRGGHRFKGHFRGGHRGFGGRRR